MYSNNENIAIGHYNITTATPTTTATKADVMDRTPILLAALSSTDCAETDSSEEDEEEDCDEEESPALAVESDGNEEVAAGDEPLSLDGDDDGDGREDEDGVLGLLLPLLLLPLDGSAGDGDEESVLLGAAEEFGVSDDSPEPAPIGPL